MICPYCKTAMRSGTMSMSARAAGAEAYWKDEDPADKRSVFSSGKRFFSPGKRIDAEVSIAGPVLRGAYCPKCEILILNAKVND